LNRHHDTCPVHTSGAAAGGAAEVASEAAPTIEAIAGARHVLQDRADELPE
jgi:hypothetical protein